MAEVNTNKLGFYKDGNWYIMNNNIFYIPYSFLNLTSGSPSDYISAIGGEDKVDELYEKCDSGVLFYTSSNPSNTPMYSASATNCFVNAVMTITAWNSDKKLNAGQLNLNWISGTYLRTLNITKLGTIYTFAAKSNNIG